MSDTLVNYYAAGSESATSTSNHENAQGTKKHLVSYCPEFGLAIETPKEGFTVKSLWEVLTND
jgi:Bardet-Biedl syndrome 5 protein